MKPTDFAGHLTKFLTDFLPGQKNVSRNTITSYRDTFKLLLRYCQEQEGIAAEAITMATLSSQRILHFLDWVETVRHCGIATRNQRLAALHSFFRYAQGEEPAGLYQFQQVIAIPVKKAGTAGIVHLTTEAMKILLAQPDTTIPSGRRHLTLMSVLYDTGARVQELIDLKVRDVMLMSPAVITLTGKGRKTRRVPLMKGTVQLLEQYLHEQDLDHPWKNEYPLFMNKQQQKLTQKGVSYIISVYAEQARHVSPVIPAKVHPHLFRHSKAMHLLQAGVNLIYIRDFLGHTDIKVTEIYARADTETKRKAIEQVCQDLIDVSNLPDWTKDQALLTWLSQL